MSISKRVRATCLWIAAALLIATGWGGAWSGLDPDTVAVTIDGRSMVFREMVAGVVEDLGNGTTRLTVAVADRKQKVEMMMAAVHPGDDVDGEMRLTTEHNEIMFMYKTPGGGFTISPSMRMARDSGMTYTPKARAGKKAAPDGPGKGERPEWSSMERSRRLAEGKGIMRNKHMEGSGFFLVIFPVMEKGIIRELRGTFSGTVRTGMGGQGGKRFITVSDGKFRVSVRGIK